LKLNTSWGLNGLGEEGSLKLGDARSWYTGERGSMCVDFPALKLKLGFVLLMKDIFVKPQLLKADVSGGLYFTGLIWSL